MRTITLSSEQRVCLYNRNRGLWRQMLALMRRCKRLEYPRDAVTITGPADTIAAIEGVLYG